MNTPDYYVHPCRLPANIEGPFYALGYVSKGQWCGDCLFCGLPESQAPDLLFPFNDDHLDTYFIKQPTNDEEIEQAINALSVCCVDALRYGGKDIDIIRRLPPEVCDYKIAANGTLKLVHKKWWEFWKE